MVGTPVCRLRAMLDTVRDCGTDVATVHAFLDCYLHETVDPVAAHGAVAGGESARRQ